MPQGFAYHNELDEEGCPAGGVVFLVTSDVEEQTLRAAHGLHDTLPALFIRWQNGPLVVDGERREPNGAFVETVIAAAVSRLEHYQTTRFVSDYNHDAIGHLNAALSVLHTRTADREARGVEGTHEL